MREAFIGIVTALVAVGACSWLRPERGRTSAASAVWEVSMKDSRASKEARMSRAHYAPVRAATRPNPPSSGPSPALTLPELTLPELAPPFPPPRVQALLENTRLERVEMNKMPLAQVVQYFADVVGADFWVNWRALEAAGIQTTDMVSLKLHDVRAARALELALRGVGGGSVHLSYRADDELVIISTADDFLLDTITRVYNVRDLLLAAASFEFELDGASRGELTVAETADRLVGIIHGTVDPASWRENGGTMAIQHFGGLFIITQTPESLRAVEQLLSELRREVAR